MGSDRTKYDRFEAISRASPVGIFHADLDANVLYTNPRVQAMWELEAPALLGRGWLQRVHPEDVDGLVRGWLRGTTAEREYEHQFRLLLPDDRVRWVHGRAAVVCDADGRAVQTVGTVEDVTADTESAERARGLLAISAALGRALTPVDVVDAVATYAEPVVGASSSMVMLRDGDGIALVGAGGLPDALRTRWEHVPLDAAIPAVEVVRTGQPVLLTDRDAMRAAFPAAYDVWTELGACALASFPLTVDTTAFGAVTFRFDRAHPFEEEDLDFLRAVVQQCAVALERARLFEDARRAREEAHEASRAKSEFLARMSHELRTPLNAIAGHLQLVEMGLHGPVTSAQREALARVGRAQRYLLGLINDVLNFTRLETGRVEFAVKPVLLADVLADVRPMVEPQLSAKALTFDAHLPEDGDAPPILVWADRDKLVQVLLNLLSNAIKFTPEGGHVTLALTKDPEAADTALVTVSDTGIGIPRERQRDVFEPFVQVHAGLTRQYQGTGLGLAISRDLAHGMGAELSVASEEGRGSTFLIRLRRAVTAAGTHTDRRTRDGRRTGLERRSGSDRRGDHEGEPHADARA